VKYVLRHYDDMRSGRPYDLWVCKAQTPGCWTASSKREWAWAFDTEAAALELLARTPTNARIEPMRHQPLAIRVRQTLAWWLGRLVERIWAGGP
jgi:hypothetical protein